ncbi:MAG: hypothetical protein ABSB57_01755 [Dehalococcoidia bacterium]
MPTMGPPQSRCARLRIANIVRAIFLVFMLGPPLVLQAEGSFALKPSADYGYLVAAATDGPGPTSYRWLRNGTALPGETRRELFFLSCDGSLMAARSQAPIASKRVLFEEGRWGRSLRLGPGGGLTYSAPGNLDLSEGTIALWVSPIADGSDPQYSADFPLLLYKAPNGDVLCVRQAGTGVVCQAVAKRLARQHLTVHRRDLVR